ncbi:hypothetical protein OS190_13100 [Sulfitobacter sp. F26204]|uniref:hypothetical protein n=1 Tax=Sulfitobacter sp. F26204 TaxID=2996014 RepID=UPI00225E6B79|nr:hypothetical protein [Sulfitobacter sp. F26204]MCX7560507.1 hypothetical protein [Sulfitobacter sp. F26204]
MAYKHIATVFMLGLLTLAPLRSQAQQASSPPDTFASENAILDTSIPFAIGAREARQELRGAFGWATFQEGLVEGVYFRFDPDGYARFAPTPRLDEDVFEVICRPRTLSCMGRKQELSMFLNTRGQLELRIEGTQPGDQFFMAEGLNEIQLPNRILQPLEDGLETLLGSGGELIMRRNEAEAARISLEGFGAVVAYLRWIVARQDYTVLPRGWPVPGAVSNGSANLTQTPAWLSPMPQPMVPQATQTTADPELNRVRDELSMLRTLLAQRALGPETSSTQAGSDSRQMPAPIPAYPDTTQRMDDIQSAIGNLERQLAQARTHPGQPAPVYGGPGLDTSPRPDNLPAEEQHTTTANGNDIARRLAYLISEIGLDPRAAVMVLQLREGKSTQVGDLATSDQVVSDIMGELRQTTRDVGVGNGEAPQVTTTDYMILSDYFCAIMKEKAFCP